MKRLSILFVVAALALLSFGGTFRSDADADHYAVSYFGSIACDVGEKIFFVANFHNDDTKIECYDKETGEISPVCRKDGCEHDNEECDAWCANDIITGMCADDEYLYWLSSDDGARCLHRMKFDGTERAPVREFTDEEIPDGLSDPYYQIYGGVLYVSAFSDPVAFSRAFPLNDGGESVELYQNFYPEEHVKIGTQPYGDDMYVLVASTETGDTDGTYNLELYSWSIESKELKEVFNREIPFFAFDYLVTDEGLVFCKGSETASVYKMDFDDGLLSEIVEFSSEEGSVDLTTNFAASWGLKQEEDSASFVIQVKTYDNKEVLNEDLAASELGGGDFYSRKLVGADDEALYYLLTSIETGEDSFVKILVGADGEAGIAVEAVS